MDLKGKIQTGGIYVGHHAKWWQVYDHKHLYAYAAGRAKASADRAALVASPCVGKPRTFVLPRRVPTEENQKK